MDSGKVETVTVDQEVVMWTEEESQSGNKVGT